MYPGMSKDIHETYFTYSNTRSCISEDKLFGTEASTCRDKGYINYSCKILGYLERNVILAERIYN